MEILKNRLKNTFMFPNDTNKFILLLRKAVYPYEFLDDLEKFNEKSLPEKEKVFSNLNMEYITDLDYNHAKRILKDKEMKNLGEYHDLYLKSDTLLADFFFENFRKMCLKMYELDPKFNPAPRLTWQTTDILLMVEIELEADYVILLRDMQKLIISI